MANTTQKKGKPVTFRPDGEWIDKACEYIAKQDSASTNLNIDAIEVKRSIFRKGIEPFFKQKGYPTTEEEWKILLEKADQGTLEETLRKTQKEVLEEINEQ